jgi:Glycosyltransferase family 87
VALIAIALGGLALRLYALAGKTGLIGYPTSYDEGVYFSASALLLRGVLPYRDFVFVHPPGILYLLTTTSWLPDAAQAFAAARVLTCVVGAIDILLIGIIAARSAGPIGGIVAAALYATYPDAIVAERSPYLEPYLNLLALASALLWLSPRDERSRKPFLAGLLCGAACAVKFWGGGWVLGAMASAPKRRDAARFIGGALVAGLVLLAPVALPAMREFVHQTLVFQVSRPPDGVLGSGARFAEIADSGHRAASVLAAIALIAIVVRLRGASREERFFSVAMLLTIAGFLASSSYWRNYNSHLAASQCVLAGFGAAALLRMPRIPKRAMAALAVLLIVALDGRSLRQSIRDARARSVEMLTARHDVPEIVPKQASFFSFDPSFSLAAGRLPPHDDGAPVVVDSYGAMLLTAVEGGGRYADTGAAFQSPVPQSAVRARLAVSDYVMLDWRGNWQMNEAERAWFASNFRCLTPEARDLCIWEQMQPQIAGTTSIESNIIRFEEGWHDQEGMPPNTWRWMERRALMTLPPIRGAARIELRFAVPLESIGAAPTISVELDDRLLERFAATTPEVARTYNLPSAGDAPHRLVITTDRFFIPARRGGSSDERELGLMLTRLTWRSGPSPVLR